MSSEVEDHIPEKSGTIKSTVQRFFIVIGVIVTLGFMVGIYYALSDESEQLEPKKLKPTESKQKKLDVDTLSSNFEDEVQQKMKNKKRADENQKKKERLALAREEKNAKKLNEESNDTDFEENKDENINSTAYDNFKAKAAEKVKTKDFKQLEMFMSKDTSYSKVEDSFAIEERKRALQARFSSLKMVSTKSGISKVEPIARTRTKNVTIKEKLAAIDQKKAKAEQLKQEIINGTFNGGDVGDLAGRLAELGMGDSVSDFSQVATTPTYSKVKTRIPRVVGATKLQSKKKDYVINGVKIPVGTIIKAALDQTIMSDYANSPYKAHVTHDVYDASYETILIPKGTVVDGRALTVSNINEPIQARMGLTTNWFILPNGNKIDLTKAAALDNAGIGAIKDEVNYHFLAQFLGVAAYAVISSETESSTSSGFTGTSNIQGDIGQSMREQFAPLASRYLGLKPTITLGVGTPITIYIEEEIILEPWGTIYDNLL
jgi:type IV secretion system protein VirB10